MVSAIRFVCRVIATPAFVVVFGFMAIMWVAFCIPLFLFLSFIHGESADTRQTLIEGWEICREPLVMLWTSKKH